MTIEHIVETTVALGDELDAALPEALTYALIVFEKQGGRVAYVSKVHPRHVLRVLVTSLIPDLERAIREGDVTDDAVPHAHEFIPDAAVDDLRCRICGVLKTAS
jgi:hypothetical protein